MYVHLGEYYLYLYSMLFISANIFEEPPPLHPQKLSSLLWWKPKTFPLLFLLWLSLTCFNVPLNHFALCCPIQCNKSHLTQPTKIRALWREIFLGENFLCNLPYGTYKDTSGKILETDNQFLKNSGERCCFLKSLHSLHWRLYFFRFLRVRSAFKVSWLPRNCWDKTRVKLSFKVGFSAEQNVFVLKMQHIYVPNFLCKKRNSRSCALFLIR